MLYGFFLKWKRDSLALSEEEIELVYLVVPLPLEGLVIRHVVPLLISKKDNECLVLRRSVNECVLEE